jgi:hydrogenase maturation factor
MGFFRLPQSSIEAFHRAPEVKMDLQIGTDLTGAYVLVTAGQLMLRIDQAVTQMQNYNRIVTRGDIDHEERGLREHDLSAAEAVYRFAKVLRERGLLSTAAASACSY